MRTVEVGIYTFTELSESAKEKAREWFRDGESQDFGAFGELWEPAQTAAKILGIDFDMKGHQLHGGKTRQEPNIMYSGFSSQGDGASFTGTFSPKHSSIDIRKEFGTDTKLHAIADALSAFHSRYILLHSSRDWSAKITQNDNHYVHKYTMYAEVYDAEGQEMDADLSKEFTEIMRDFAQWIYDGLEAEYDYRMSDACIDEAMESNEYEFTEDGEPA